MATGKAGKGSASGGKAGAGGKRARKNWKQFTADMQRPDLAVNLAVWWLWMPLAATLLWLVKHFVFGHYGQQDQDYVLFLQKELFPRGTPLHPTPLFWIWFLVGLAGTLVLVRTSIFARLAEPGSRKVRVATGVIVLAMAFSAVYAWDGLWDGDKDEAAYYSQDTAFYVGSVTPPPSSLKPLTVTDRASTGSCDYVGTADVPSCIRVAAMPDFDWEPRTASYEAAKTVMTNSSSLASQVDVMQSTVHYLPGVGGQGVWTAVLDGSGTRAAEGVAVWDGQSNTASICEFQGADSFNRAFGGIADNSLRNLLAAHYPHLVYADTDISGYCDGAGAAAHPVIVIPVQRQTAWRDRTVMRPAGVLVLTGSPSGAPDIAYHATVAPGEFPCQVYPQSLVATQVDDLDWAAGRGNMNDAGFGYERTSVDSNSSNPGEYILRSAADGHLYFVTPLTPRASASQAVVAYAVERADEVSGGLNPLAVYVEADSTDPTSLTVLTSRMSAYINQVAPALLSSGSGGRLDEIIPFGNGMWRGFLDIGGVTQDYIDVSGDTTVPPKLVVLPGHGSNSGTGTGAGAGATGTGSGPTSGTQPSAGAGSTPSPGSTLGCGGDPETMSSSQLAQCIEQFASVLGGRQETPSPSPTQPSTSTHTPTPTASP